MYWCGGGGGVGGGVFGATSRKIFYCSLSACFSKQRSHVQLTGASESHSAHIAIHSMRQVMKGLESFSHSARHTCSMRVQSENDFQCITRQRPH